MSAPTITPKLFKLEGNNLKTKKPTDITENPMSLLIQQLLQQIPSLPTTQIRPEDLNAQPGFNRGLSNRFSGSNFGNNVTQGGGRPLF